MFTIVQLQVLNRILSAKDSSLLVLNNLNSDFFSDYKNEFNFINEHITKYNTIPDIETFLSKFPNFDILNVAETDKYLIEELYSDYNRRKLAKIFNKVRTLLNENKVDEAMNLYMTASEDVSTATHLESVDILRDTSRYDKYIEKTHDFNKFYVKTGFKELDALIGGWDRYEELATIAARPGVGKSWILLKIAIAAAEQGLNVGLYSGEMSELKVGYRADTLISHLSNGQLIHGNTAIQNDYKYFLDNLGDKFTGHIRVITPSMIGGPAGVTALRAFIEKEKLDMLCIDQHSLLEDDRRAKNPVEKAANISKDLKNLQVMKKIPIIAVSQQNRSSTEGGIDTSHIAQSDRISQDSTIVIFIEHKDDVLTLNLTKSRDAANGKSLKYIVNLDKGIFEFSPDNIDGMNEESCEALKAEFETCCVEGEDVF